VVRQLAAPALTVILLIACQTSDARAALATGAEAEMVAANWLTVVTGERGSWGSCDRPSLGASRAIVVGDTLLGWCFAVDPSGHIVVPVLKTLPPVKAYSETHDVDITADAGYPLLVRQVLQSRARSHVRRHGDLAAPAPQARDDAPGTEARRAWDLLAQSPGLFLSQWDRSARPNRTEVGPLLTTSWHQEEPYNLLCPLGDGGQCVVGCVATAVAQIMRYHEAPAYGDGWQQYLWGGDWSCGGSTPAETLFADFSDAYDWDSMPDECLTSGCLPEEEGALAELCYEVGVAFNMEYGHCGSGASITYAGIALPLYFRYVDDIDDEYRIDHTTQSWSDLIASEINQGRPVLYGMSMSMGGGGHALVCDGWRDTGGLKQYHMNYGWGGAFDAWYVIDDMYGTYDPLQENIVRRIEPDLPPSAPVGLAATPDDNAVLLSWAPNAESDLDFYEVERDTSNAFGPSAVTEVAEDASFVAHPLLDGREYFFRIRAVDARGTVGDYGCTVSCVPQAAAPLAPGGLAAEPGDGSVEITWNGVAAPDLSHYIVYRDTAPGFAPSVAQAQVDTTRHTDTTAINYRSYYYRVTAVDSGGLEGGASDDVRAVAHGRPPAPSALRAAPLDSAVFLTWSDVDCPGLDRYDVLRDTSASMQSPVLDEGFEGYVAGSKPSGPWIVVEETGTRCRVTDSHSASGSKSLALVDSTYGYTRVFHTFPDTTCRTARIEWMVRPSIVDGEDLLQCEIFGEKGMSYPAGVVELSDGWLGHWTYGGDPEALAPCAAGEWHHILWQLDCESDTYDLTLDGTPVALGASFYQPAGHLKTIQYRTQAAEHAGAWIDDVRWAIEPSCVASAQDTLCLDASVANGLTYFYRIAAVDTFGVSGPPGPIADVVPGGTGVPSGADAVHGPSLSPGRPNPFASVMALSYAVPSDGAMVRLRVYDVAGRVVRTLVDGRRGGGIHRLSWDGRDDAGRTISSGVYFLRITIDDWTQSRKTVLIR